MRSSSAMSDAPPTAMERALVPGIALLAAVHLGIALWMVADSRGFYEQVGPFGAYNSHYIGDAAAFTGGVGLALAAALRWPALRGGVLATAAAVTGLHAFNHWTDLNAANGDSGADVFGAVSLTIQFAFTLLLVRVALRRSTA